VEIHALPQDAVGDAAGTPERLVREARLFVEFLRSDEARRVTSSFRIDQLGEALGDR
jgi:hypothetical protein